MQAEISPSVMQIHPIVACKLIIMLQKQSMQSTARWKECLAKKGRRNNGEIESSLALQICSRSLESVHSASGELLRALKLALFMPKEYLHCIIFLCLIVSRFRGIVHEITTSGFIWGSLRISIIHLTSLFTQLTKNITWKVMRGLFSEQSKSEIEHIMYSVSSATKSPF